MLIAPIEVELALDAVHFWRSNRENGHLASAIFICMSGAHAIVIGQPLRLAASAGTVLTPALATLPKPAALPIVLRLMLPN